MINLFEPDLGPQELALLAQVAATKWLGRGSYVSEFETLFAEFQKVDSHQVHTISCCSDAIFGVLDILGIHAGDEVIVPSISFPSIGSAVVKAGAQLVITDSCADTGNIDLNKLLGSVTPKTKAVFVTHYGGVPVDIGKIRELVGPDILILEDAACAFGSFKSGKAVGTEGDFGCWSFDAMKLLTCGEGGAMYFANPGHIERAKEYFYLGLPAQTKSGIDRQGTDDRWWEYQLTMPGRRSVFTNVNAAFGIPQFSTLSVALDRREAIRARYIECLDSLDANYIKQSDHSVTYSNYFFTVLTPDRDDLANHLKQLGIYSTFRYYPLHLIDIFKQYSNDCPGANQFSETALNIPIHQNLSDGDVSLICDALNAFFQ